MGGPIGRQPIRAGLHRPWSGTRTVNITHKEVTINNFGNGFFPIGGYGCYDTGLSKGEKWGIGLAAGLGGAAAILSAFLPNNTEGKGNIETPAELTDAQKKELQEQETILAQAKKDIETLQQENSRLQEQIDAITQLKQQSKEYQAGAEPVKQKAEYETFNVEAEKIGDKYKGHTGYNIVAGKYTRADGKKLTDSEIKDICEQIFKGKALPTGEIQLPKKITVNNITYSYNKEGKVDKSEYSLSNIDTYKSEATQVGDKFVPTVNGERVGNDLYDSKEEAVKVAKDKISELKAAESEE